MWSPLSLVAATLLGGCLIPTTFAQSQFSTPDSSAADFSITYYSGQTITITWVKGWKGVGDALDTADLFVTWAKSDDYWQLLKANVTFDTAGSYSWKININDTTLASSNMFVFRFKQHYDPVQYTASSNESPSRQFLIQKSQSTTTTTGSSTISTASSTSTSSATAPTLATNPGNDNNTAHRTGLIVGAALGTAIFCGILIGLIAWIYVRRGKKRRALALANNQRVLHEYYPGYYTGGYQPVQNRGAYSPETMSQISTITTPAELDPQREISELDATKYTPLAHR